MTRLIPAAALLALLGGTAHAQTWNETQIGQFRYYNGTDANGGAWTGNSNQIGQFRYDHFYGPNGQTRSCTSNQIGQFTYTNCN